MVDHPSAGTTLLEEGGASLPVQGRLGCARWGTGGSGWIPRVENPGHPEISQRSSAEGVDFVSCLGFILGRASVGSHTPIRCTAKSAEVIDGKGVVDAPLLQRVREPMKRKTLHSDVALGET